MLVVIVFSFSSYFIFRFLIFRVSCPLCLFVCSRVCESLLFDLIFVFCCLILEKLRLGLQGQLEDVNVYTQEGIHFIQDVRDFMKERIALEEEYADKLEKITKTYSKKSKKFTKLFSTSASRTRKESIASEELAVDDSK